jgi:hypothetical protein
LKWEKPDELKRRGERASKKMREIQSKSKPENNKKLLKMVIIETYPEEKTREAATTEAPEKMSKENEGSGQSLFSEQQQKSNLFSHFWTCY